MRDIRDVQQGEKGRSTDRVYSIFTFAALGAKRDSNRETERERERGGP